MTTKQVMRGFTVILMVLVGAVFVAGPAGLLAKRHPMLWTPLLDSRRFPLLYFGNPVTRR